MSRSGPESREPSRGDLAVRFQKLKAQIHRQLVEGLDLSRLHLLKPERLRREVRELATQLSRHAPEMLNELERERLVDEIMDEAFGLGPLEAAMKNPSVSDILVNGPREVYLERNGRLELSDIIFADDAHLMQVIQRVAARVGRRVDEASPMVDARLPDGSRVNAIIPPLALNGPVLSIRRFGVRLTAEDLVGNGSLPADVLTLLTGCVEARLNVLISGGTGSGKTTMLNTLSAFIPHDERVVTIEDAAELNLLRPHVVRLETRPSNLEGSGEVRQRDLVRNALRMRPDRIIIGEVRGGEALDMLQAMNTGHEGSLTTIHANDTRDALARLEAMVMLAGFELPVPVIRQYVTTALSVVVHLARLKGGPRRVMRVSEVVGLRREDGTYRLRDLFGFRQLGIRDGRAHGEFYATGRLPRFLPKLKAMGVDLPEALFEKRILAAEAGEPDAVVESPDEPEE
jgi:pilus assembly protein CpaF